MIKYLPCVIFYWNDQSATSQAEFCQNAVVELLTNCNACSYTHTRTHTKAAEDTGTSKLLAEGEK